MISNSNFDRLLTKQLVRLESQTSRFLDKEAYEDFVEKDYFFHVPEEGVEAMEQCKINDCDLD